MHPSVIGPFKIERELGRGGMGEVFLARDTRLDRQVAIKALPAHLAQDPDRLARFQREAKVLASLSHPGIGAIYGLEESGGRQYLILEFVEGVTLADRLERGPIPVEESLALAKQIAEALEIAHEKGVVHRDLKPGNVMVTPDGVVKVLDFGLARTSDGAASSTKLPVAEDSPTIPIQSPTIPGAIMGTAGYMSPEQARGKPVDKRSDIFSFGCVLFEMLTGAQPFPGETVADTIGATLHKESDLNLLPSNTPARVRELLTICLAKERKQRLNDIGDARLALDRALAGREWANAAAHGSPIPRPWSVALTALLLIASGGWVWVGWHPARTATRPSQTLDLAIPMPKGQEIVGSIAISRDGERVAFTTEDQTGESRLYIRNLGRFEFIAVPDSRDARNPAFTSDGRSVLFCGHDGLRRAPVDGGGHMLLVPSPSMMSSCALDDGSVVYSTGVGSPLWRLPTAGGTPVAITDLSGVPGTYAHVWPQQIPGTSKLLLTAWCEAGGGPRIMDTRTGDVREIGNIPNLVFVPPARWVGSGHLILEAFDRLLAVAFDPETGGSFEDIERNQVLTSVAHLGTKTRCVFDVSDNGTLAYVPAEPANPRLVWVSADGTVKNVLEAKDTSGFDMRGDVCISPDGTQALVGGLGDIAVVDLNRGIPRRITLDQGSNLFPIWSSDGSRVLFGSNRQERWAVWSVAASGPATPELVYKGTNSTIVKSVSSDGRLCVDEHTANTGINLLIIDPQGAARPLVQTRYDESGGVFSTNGKWVAYESNISGRDEIYVIRSTGDDQPVQVSFGGGKAPKWGPLGTLLYYRVGRSIVRIPMAEGRPKGDPERVFEGPTLERGHAYSLSPDETRLLAVEIAEESIGDEIRIISNFFERLREVAGPGSRQPSTP
ncbi:MAG: serine/threonine-protein kinase [Phycisphaerales bacterium]|nr:serine/threonine-protein kinase [Phycisphaerales bacterium]